jgi:hypothetical protein
VKRAGIRTHDMEGLHGCSSIPGHPGECCRPAGRRVTWVAKRREQKRPIWRAPLDERGVPEIGVALGMGRIMAVITHLRGPDFNIISCYDLVGSSGCASFFPFSALSALSERGEGTVSFFAGRALFARQRA